MGSNRSIWVEIVTTKKTNQVVLVEDYNPVLHEVRERTVYYVGKQGSRVILQKKSLRKKNIESNSEYETTHLGNSLLTETQ